MKYLALQREFLTLFYNKRIGKEKKRTPVILKHKDEVFIGDQFRAYKIPDEHLILKTDGFHTRDLGLFYRQKEITKTGNIVEIGKDRALEFEDEEKRNFYVNEKFFKHFDRDIRVTTEDHFKPIFVSDKYTDELLAILMPMRK